MANIFSKLRFLPLTIFFATLLLTIKINDIWDGVGGFRNSSIQFARALAQTEKTSNEEPEKKKPEAQAVDKKPEDQTAEEETKDKPPEKADANPDSGNEDEGSRLITDDPTLLSPAEIELLQQLGWV